MLKIVFGHFQFSICRSVPDLQTVGLHIGAGEGKPYYIGPVPWRVATRLVMQNADEQNG